MASAGLPEPIKRPGIGILAVQGKQFELDRNDELVRLFGANIRHARGASSYGDLDLRTTLLSGPSLPSLILQGHFSVSPFQSSILSNIGVTPSEIPLVPPLGDFIPDVVIVRNSEPGDSEIYPNGARGTIDPTTETRAALCILDIKHTAEANPSYCSEIAMYALMLSNWINADSNLSKRYFVCVKSYLWTRYKQGDSKLEELSQRGGATHDQLLAALISDSEDAQLRYYLASIRGFFEDVARVVRIGLSRPNGWQDLDWHVSSTCGNCDWLGDKRHMGQNQRALVDAKPANYCMPLANQSGHLCLVPGVTRGAKKVLNFNTVSTASALATASGHPALQQHTILKREAKTLPARSAAITSGTLSTDASGVIASLVSSANLLLYASVNFDSSSGLLTGLSLSGTATNFTPGQSPRGFGAVPFVVDQKSLSAEWVALEGFLTQIASCIDIAEGITSGTVTGQIHFWDHRQFQELCNAMGRHLPRVMALASRKAKALAWVFASEDRLARPDSLEAATVVAVEEVVRRLVFAPSRHVITLFDTVDHYRSGPSLSVTDSYYREYLSNGIPRERIYEIWSNSTQIKRGAGNVIPRNTVIAQYSDALQRQSRALESVCERLRQDYRGQFRAKATRIPTSIPRGAQGVAFDAKLWIWWDQLEFNASQLEAHIRLAMDGERLEAEYEAIVLSNGVHAAGDLYDFDVGSGSAEAKFKEDSMLTLGKLGHPGLPLQHASKLLQPTAPSYNGNSDLLSMPLWSVLEAKLVQFDRTRLKVRVQLQARDEPQFIPYLIANSTVPLLNDVFLLETKKPRLFNWAEYSAPILGEIGDPAIATPDPNAAAAMGIAPAARRASRSIQTPASRVLWEPTKLEAQVITPAQAAGPLATYVANLDRLNSSQEAAVLHAIERGLTMIWGPPGTGKTKTLASILHALTVLHNGKGLCVLVTGPTYKAVEEVMHRAASCLSADPTGAAKLYMGYSRGRPHGQIPGGLAGYVSYRLMTFDNSDATLRDCLNDLGKGQEVVIVGCHVRQARRFPKYFGNTALNPLFDVVLIDESSQVPVSHALSPLSGLRDPSRLIVAGDHLQMPPISSIEAPSDAAYMVGSIQTYLAQRPFIHSMQSCVLERNYRSAEAIVAFARDIGYPQSLTAEYSGTCLHFISPLQPRASYPSHLPWCADFYDVLKPDAVTVTLLHEDEISSQGNLFEAQTVAGIVWMLRQSVSAYLDGWGTSTPQHRIPTPAEFWQTCVGVVTPHRAQRALVVRELERIFPGEQNLIADAVDTVERFQGGERHTIIVTFGVADVDVIGGEEAFLMQLERTNVAISRAMGKCIVVMPDALAEHIPEDKRALQTAFALKDYIEEFCNVRIKTALTETSGLRRAEIRYHG